MANHPTRTQLCFAPGIVLIASCLICLAWTPIASSEEPSGPTVEAGTKDPFDDFDDEQDYPTRNQLESILAEVKGHRYQIVQRTRNNRPVCYVSGLFRLGGDWEDSGLRLSLWDAEQIRVHVWSGQRGVLLQYCRDSHQTWAAYGTTREDDNPEPSELALWATDNGRYRRLGLGTVEVHFRHNNLILIRGDQKLIEVPMQSPPSDVFLESTGLVRGLSMVASSELHEVRPAGQVALRIDKPSALNWQAELPEKVSLNTLPDGPVELAAEPRTPEAQAATTVSLPGLCEIRFQVDDARPGSGIYLGDIDGNQLCRIGFFRDRQTGRTTFSLLEPWNREVERTYDDRRKIVPYAGRRQWLRLTIGAGIVQLWTSGDGDHWSQIAPSDQPLEGVCSRIGLYCLAHDKPRSIRLRSIEVRRLDALDALAAESARQQVEAVIKAEEGSFVKAGNLEDWEQQVADSKPPDVETDVWWSAAAIGTLAAGPKVELGQQLLDSLLKRALSEAAGIQQQNGLDEQLRLLDEAALLLRSRDWQAVDWLGAWYRELGLHLARQGHATPFTTLSRSLMQSPLWTERRLPVFDEDLLRHELFAQLGRDRWREVWGLCHRLAYWDRIQSQEPPCNEQVRYLYRWAARAVEDKLEDGQASPALLHHPPHPLIERASKEGYNLLAELEAAIDARTYREACQIITTLEVGRKLGVLPDERDGRLWVSLEAALELAMLEHPALRDTMREEFDSLGKLRLKQATAAGDSPAVELVALQFCGAGTASEAHLWLGDRDLSVGRFGEAADHYRLALRGVPVEDQAELLARVRLACAMNGRDVGKPLGGPVQIGDKRISAAQFERLVERTRQSQSTSSSVTDAAGTTQDGIPPGAYQARQWAFLDGRHVKRPSTVSEEVVDWAGRQTSVLVTDSRMFVANQIELAAYDLASGRRTWAQRRSVDAKYQQRPLLAMQPVIDRQRLLVRQLGEEGLELACFDAASGQLSWSSRPPGQLVSDPLVIAPDIFSLVVSQDAGDELAVSLAGFDPQTGHVRFQAPLVEFRDFWNKQLDCRMTLADGRIVATGGGSAFCFHPSGKVDWLRRQVWFPRPGGSYSQAPKWFEQFHERPLVEDGRVYAAQPGVWGIECIDLETGRLLWRRAIGELRRLLGRVSNRLIVQTTGGLLALDAGSGETLWHYDPDARFEAAVCEDSGLILTYRVEPSAESDGPSQLVICWISADTGQQSKSHLASVSGQPGPWFGPMVLHGGRQWTFLPVPENPASRQIAELLPR